MGKKAAVQYFLKNVLLLREPLNLLNCKLTCQGCCIIFRNQVLIKSRLITRRLFRFRIIASRHPFGTFTKKFNTSCWSVSPIATSNNPGDIRIASVFPAYEKISCAITINLFYDSSLLINDLVLSYRRVKLIQLSTQADDKIYIGTL